MQIQSFDKSRIYYRIKRKSDIFLVFVHGWNNNWTAWKKIIGLCERAGYSTLAVDLRGHGVSDKPVHKHQYSMECFAKDLNEVITHENIEKFILVGQSMGGMISLTYYKMFPQGIKAMVLVDTTYKNVLMNTRYEGLSSIIKRLVRFFESLAPKKDRKRYDEDIDLSRFEHNSDISIFWKSLKGTPARSVLFCLDTMMHFDMKPVLRRIKVPVLLIEGTKDFVLPDIDRFEMFLDINVIEIEFIQNATHCVNIQHPDAIFRHISQFMGKYNLKNRLSEN